MDSNHRSQRQQIYSLPPLAARESHRLERVKGIEPSQSAWKADVLPLNYTRIRYGAKFTTLSENVKLASFFFITFSGFSPHVPSLPDSHRTKRHSHRPGESRCRKRGATQNPHSRKALPGQTEQDPQQNRTESFPVREDETVPRAMTSPCGSPLPAEAPSAPDG